MTKLSAATLINTLLLILSTQFITQAHGASKQVQIDNPPWQLIGDWQPAKTKETKGVVLLLHKAAGDRTAYNKMAKVLAKRGYASLRLDLRGHGQSINAGKFDPNISRFENKNDPAVVANFKLIRQGDQDIAAAINWLNSKKLLKNKPFVIIGSSYTGEEMVQAVFFDKSKHQIVPDAFIALAPGNFSADSLTQVDPSKKPWLFVRAEQEMSFFDGIFDAIKKGSKAEIWVIPGKGHATDLFLHNDDLEKRLVDWIEAKLADTKNP